MVQLVAWLERPWSARSRRCVSKAVDSLELHPWEALALHWSATRRVDRAPWRWDGVQVD